MLMFSHHNSLCQSQTMLLHSHLLSLTHISLHSHNSYYHNGMSIPDKQHLGWHMSNEGLRCSSLGMNFFFLLILSTISFYRLRAHIEWRWKIHTRLPRHTDPWLATSDFHQHQYLEEREVFPAPGNFEFVTSYFILLMCICRDFSTNYEWHPHQHTNMNGEQGTFRA